MLRSAFILLFSLFTVYGQAQLVCDFTADTTRGCAPIQVNFTSLSNGPRPIIYYDWDFGNSGFSSQANPSRVYSNPGQYTVRLTVSDGVDTVTKTVTQYITVHQNPVADFSYNLVTKCKPVRVDFTDNTTVGSAPIKTWKWDYGDLTTPGTTQNPTHLYNNRGTFSVSLQVTDTNGCISDEQKLNIIVVDPPEARFSASKRSDCNPPLTTTFNNSSVGGAAPVTYAWDFGDGNSSSATSPTHTYTAAGFYDVTLIVTDANGCKDTLKQTKYITIAQTLADFSFPDTLCKGMLDTFVNQSVGANTFQWTFGTQGSSTLRDPHFKFSTSGNHQVKLVASSGPGCLDSVTKTVYVQVVNPSFTVHYDSICQPNKVRFKNTTPQSLDSMMYRHPYLPQGSDYRPFFEYTHTYPPSSCAKKTYDVEQWFLTTAGCKDSVMVKDTVTILNDFIGIGYTSGGPCVPSWAHFTSNSCFRFKPLTWQWTFNSGTPPNGSTVPQPADTIRFNQRGKFNITLQVTDSMGCKHSAALPLEFGEKPQANFTWNPDTVCLGENVDFISLSTDSNKITDYDWTFTPGGGSVGKRTKYAFGNTPGWIDVKLEVSDHGCKDDTTINKAVYVSGPKVSVTQSPRCANPLEQAFVGHIKGGYTRYYWDFGDGSPLDSTTLTPVHTYGSQGFYLTKFYAYNDASGCADTFFHHLTAAPLAASFTYKGHLCAGETAEFDATSSIGNIGINYFWDFGNGYKPILNPKQSVKYNQEGIYNAQLIVMSQDSCFDTVIKPVYVHDPMASMDFVGPVICAGDSLVFSSTSYTDSSRATYEWFLDTVSLSKDSILPRRWPLKADTTFGYRITADTHQLKLRIETFYGGCADSLIMPIFISYPRANYTIDDSTICRGDSVLFQDLLIPNGGSIKWYFGTGDSSTAISPKYSYPTSGKYQTKYVVSHGQCSDTMVKNLTVQGIDTVAFYSNLRDTNCYPAPMLFFDQSVGDSLKWFTWDFGDGKVPIRTQQRDSLNKVYTEPGIFDVKLIVETSNGCKDSATVPQYIRITGPWASYSIVPDSVCKYEPLSFVLDTMNPFAYSFVWDFGDGRVDSTGRSVDTLHHVYTRVGKINAVMVLEDSLKTCKVFNTREVVVEEVIADFRFNPDSIGCMPFEMKLQDRSQLGDTWTYSFGDGNSSNQADPENTYLQDGDYTVTLVYENSQNGCKDTIQKPVRVHPLPVITASSDQWICLEDSIRLTATGGNIYNWSPNNQIDDTTKTSPTVWPSETRAYYVEGRDSNWCANYDTTWVFVQQKPTLTMPRTQ
ncbi:PKD domain-containing protein [bacterium SCSIO 12741]|nr:PKD domain-containing protein [bacterium SCSIO 12741]